MKDNRRKQFIGGFAIIMFLMVVGCTAQSTPPPTSPPPTVEEQIAVVPTDTAVPTATTQPTNTPAPTNTAVPSPTPTPLPTETPAPTETPTPSFPFQDVKPILPPGAYSWESTFIDPGGVVFQDGQFHMFYNGLSGWPRHVKVGYATSDDGLNWTRMSDTPVFTGEGIEYTGISVFISSANVLDDGTWALYFYTIDTGNFSGPGKIGRATADSPLGPFVADPEPILLPGPEGSWDDHAVLNPNVVKVDDGFVMYYDGNMGDSETNRDRQIGMATSPDGAVWTKYNIESTTAVIVAESDPIFKTGRSGTWDRDRVIDPNIFFSEEDGWVMLYLSSQFNTQKQRRDYGVGVAFSEDGINWERPDGENQFLSTLNDKGWNAIFLATAVYNSGTTYLYYDVQASSQSGTVVYGASFEGSLLPQNNN